MELIDKSTVVAGIEDKICKYTKCGEESDANHDGCGMYWGGVISCLNEIRSFLDTLETKDVDLEKESMNYILHEHKSPLNYIMHQVDLKTEMQYQKDIQDAFKAGYNKAMEERK